MMERVASHKLASARCTEIRVVGPHSWLQPRHQHPRRVAQRNIATCNSSNESIATTTSQSLNGRPAVASAFSAMVSELNGSSVVPTKIEDEQVVTKFIAETLLPTRHGKYRVRGYKHSVCSRIQGFALRACNPIHVGSISSCVFVFL